MQNFYHTTNQTSFLIWSFSKSQEEIYGEDIGLRLREKIFHTNLWLQKCSCSTADFIFARLQQTLGGYRTEENTAELSIHTTVRDYFFLTRACFTARTTPRRCRVLYNRPNQPQNITNQLYTPPDNNTELHLSFLYFGLPLGHLRVSEPFGFPLFAGGAS